MIAYSTNPPVSAVYAIKPSTTCASDNPENKALSAVWVSAKVITRKTGVAMNMPAMTKVNTTFHIGGASLISDFPNQTMPRKNINEKKNKAKAPWGVSAPVPGVMPINTAPATTAMKNKTWDAHINESTKSIALAMPITLGLLVI